ncbi:MAG: AAA family ATPase [Acholeplasmataceae bacterium]
MKKALHFFEQAIKKNRLSHLYLISGPKGSGKSQLADEVSYLILNQNKPENKHLKMQISKRIASNVMVIEPDGLTLKKEQIIQLQTEFSKTALVKGPRVYILNHVEKMNQSAANSLLKFMEEPSSSGVYGFLLTDNIEDVIQTIISRSQVIHLKEVNEFILKETLLEQGISENIATLAPYLTKDVDQATLLSEDPNFIAMLEYIENIAKNWGNRNISYPVFMHKFGGVVLQDREVFKNFLELLLLYYVDLIHYRANQPITYQYLKEYIQVQSDQMKVNQIHDLIESIQDIIKKQTYYINIELALDELSYILEKKR